MKKALFSILVTSLTAVSLTSFAVEDKYGSHEHLCQKLKGDFSYLVRGDFNNSSVSGKVTEVGVFTSDGKGTVTANATVNMVGSDLATPLPSGQANYNCTYTNADCASNPGLITLHCIRHQSNLTPQDQNLDIVLAMVKGSATVRIETLSGGTFGNVQVAGEGSRSID